MPPTSSTSQTRSSRALLWYAFLGAPVAWLVHIGARYPLVPTACAHDLMLVLHMITAVTLVLTLGAAVAAVVFVVRARPGPPSRQHPPSSRVRYMALVGLAFSLLFAAVIAAELLPSLMQDPCVHVRL